MANRLGDPRRDSNGASRIVLNSFTPGYCSSGLTQRAHSLTAFGFWILKKTTARTTEVGGRTLVAAIAKGEESHGKYLNDCEVDEWAPSFETYLLLICLTDICALHVDQLYLHS